MKLINLTILSILAEAMVVNGAAINQDNCSEEFLPKEIQDHDTRLLMPNVEIDPTADYSENVRILKGSTPNVPVQKETAEVAEKEISPAEKKSKFAELGRILETTRVQMEQSISGNKVDLEKYLPLRKEFLETFDQIKKLDTEGTKNSILQNYSRVPPRIDQVAREMCQKDTSKAGCDSI